MSNISCSHCSTLWQSLLTNSSNLLSICWCEVIKCVSCNRSQLGRGKLHIITKKNCPLPLPITFHLVPHYYYNIILYAHIIYTSTYIKVSWQYLKGMDVALLRLPCCYQIACPLLHMSRFCL